MNFNKFILILICIAIIPFSYIIYYHTFIYFDSSQFTFEYSWERQLHREILANCEEKNDEGFYVTMIDNFEKYLMRI